MEILTLEQFTRDILNIIEEGGGYGHLSHVYDDVNLTFKDLKKIIEMGVEGTFTKDNFIQEKCLHPDSVVHLEKNGYKTIKEVVDNTIRDRILSYDFKQKKTKFKKILGYSKNSPSDIWLHITLDNHQWIKVTPNHRMLLSDGTEKKAEQLQIGDLLVTERDSIHQIKTIQQLNETHGCYDLTIDEFSNYFANGILVHNTDGQNIMVTFKDDQIRFARTNTQIRNAGEKSLTIDGIYEYFNTNESLPSNVKMTFIQAADDLKTIFDSLNKKSDFLNKMFLNGKRFMSIEIISPKTQNVIPYGTNLLIPHGWKEYDEKGNQISEDKQSGIDLGKIISKYGLSKQKTFTFREPNNIDLSPLPDSQEKEDEYFKMLEDKIMNPYNLGLSNTILDYLHKRGEKLLLKKIGELKKSDISLPLLVERLLGLNKTLTLTEIKRKIEDPDVLSEYMELENNRKDFTNEVYTPIKKLFFDLGNDIIKNISTLLVSNKDKASIDMKKELDSTINAIKGSNDEKKLKTLQKQLEFIGGEDKLKEIIPSEGITFVYNNKLYKFTGNFAVINRINGLLKFNN